MIFMDEVITLNQIGECRGFANDRCGSFDCNGKGQNSWSTKRVSVNLCTDDRLLWPSTAILHWSLRVAGQSVFGATSTTIKRTAGSASGEAVSISLLTNCSSLSTSSSSTRVVEAGGDGGGEGDGVGDSDRLEM